MFYNNKLIPEVISVIRNVVGDAPVPLHAPDFNGKEWAYVKETLDTSFVSSVGEFVNSFENALAEYTGAEHAVAVVNGTAALHIALLLSGVQPNDEVLTPTLSFIATANAISYCGAKPHFVDCEERSLGIDADKLRRHLESTTKLVNGQCINNITGRAIRALVPMHVFGHPCDMDKLLELAGDFNLVVVEDAAESLGSFYHGRHTGTLGLVGTLSFNGNKVITTGGGGALLLNDGDLARRAKHITTTAKIQHPWEYKHSEVGFNYRLPNINAALGCAQLESLSLFLSEKRRLFESYRSAFKNVEGADLLVEPPGCTSNYWLQTLVLGNEYAHLRDDLLAATNEAGIMTRPAWSLMHRLAPYLNMPRMDLSVAENLESRIINIPSSSVLGRIH